MKKYYKRALSVFLCAIICFSSLVMRVEAKTAKLTVTTKDKNAKGKKLSKKITNKSKSKTKTAKSAFKKAAYIPKGSKLKLTLKGAKAKKVKWKIANKKIASVKKGLITAKKAGTTTVTVKYKKKTKKCTLVVYAAKKLGTKKVNEENNIATIGNVKLNLTPYMFSGKSSKATVKKISGLPKYCKTKMSAYDFSLNNVKVSSANPALLSIPYKAKKGKIPVAGYYNYKKAKWENVPCNYDGKYINIIVSHFSPYGVGEASALDYVLFRRTTKAYPLSGWVPSTPSLTGERAVQIMQGAMNSDKPTKSCIDLANEAINQLFEFGVNWRGNFGQAFKFKDSFTKYTSDYSTEIGVFGFALAYVNAIIYALKGEKYQAASTAYQGLLSFGTGLGFSWIGTTAASAAALSVAIVSFALNKGISDTLDANEKKWYDVYSTYYKKGGSGYRSIIQWRDILLPIMENTSLTPKQKQQEIDNEVMNYAWKLWNNEAEIAYIFNDVQTKALKGGLNYDLKTKLSDQLVNKINNYELKIFFEWYSKKSQRDAEKLAQDMRDKIAADLAEEVKITFKDPTRKAGKKSVLKNWIVRWKNIPKKIKDKKNLKLKVKSDGTAQTYHTVYAAVAYGIKPVVNICTPKGKVVDTQTMVFKSRSNTYNLMTKKVKEYLKSHKCKLNKTKLTLTAGGKYTLKLTNAKASKVKWKTSNKRVATVKNGKIKAKKKGSATITAIYKKKKYRCKLTVKASAKKKTNYWKYAGSYTKDIGANTPVNVEVGSCTKTVDKTISASNGVFNIKTVTNALEGGGSGSWGDAAHEGLCKNETASATFTFSALPKSYKLDQKVNLTLRGTFNQSKPMCYNDTMSNLTCSSYITTVNPSANPIPASNWYITGHTFGYDMDCHVLSQSKTVSGAVSVPGYLDQLKSGDVFYVVEYAYAGGDRDKYGAYYVIHKYQWVGKK